MNNFQFYLDCQGFAEILYVIIASNPQTISFLHFTYICKIIHVHFKNSKIKLIKIKISKQHRRSHIKKKALKMPPK